MTTDEEPIYIDYTTFSTYMTCNELARLQFKLHLRPRITAPALDFGGAFHKALEVYRLSPQGEPSVGLAETAFVDYCREHRAALPLSIMDDEKRSVERGLYLLRAYIKKWWYEPYDPVFDSEGKPFVEMPFKVYLGRHLDRPIYLVGRIDMVSKSRITGRLYNWETKTTSMALSNFQRHCRPNHQVTIYEMVLRHAFNLDIAGTIWDMIFVSSRKPSAKFPQGIDLANDFMRVETKRTDSHFEKLLSDIVDVVRQMLDRDPTVLWPQNMPKACYMYGGCPMLRVCDSLHNPDLIKTDFEEKPWEPWKMEPDQDAISSAQPSGSNEQGG